MDGFLLIDKERGWTSRDVCNKIQGMFHTKKVGHIGTLDPFATGLLIVSLGKATKAGAFLNAAEKEYIAELVLGTKTSTGDRDGEVIEKSSVPQLNDSLIDNVFKALIGELQQIPPMTSAIHYNGQKLYRLAHEGIEVERTPRTIFIKDLSLISFKGNVITFKTTVSKGTYVRSLGETIAERLGCVGYLESLRRIKIGTNLVDNAKLISNVSNNDLLNVYDCLKFIKSVIVDDNTVTKIKNGIPYNFKSSEQYILVIDKDYNAIAVYEFKGNMYYCLRGLW